MANQRTLAYYSPIASDHCSPHRDPMKEDIINAARPINSVLRRNLRFSDWMCCLNALESMCMAEDSVTSSPHCHNVMHRAWYLRRRRPQNQVHWNIESLVQADDAQLFHCEELKSVILRCKSVTDLVCLYAMICIFFCCNEMNQSERR